MYNETGTVALSRSKYYRPISMCANSPNWNRLTIYFMTDGPFLGSHDGIQWNPYIADTVGELQDGCYRGLAIAVL